MIKELFPAREASDFTLLKIAYLELFNAPDNFPYLTLTLKPFDEETVSQWLQKHEEFGVHYYAKIDNSGEILGLALTRVDVVTGYELLSLSIHPGCKRRGIGKSLVEHTLSIAEQSGYKAVDIQVYANNKAMLKLLLDQDCLPVRMSHHMGADGTDIVHMKKYF